MYLGGERWRVRRASVSGWCVGAVTAATSVFWLQPRCRTVLRICCRGFITMCPSLLRDTNLRRLRQHSRHPPSDDYPTPIYFVHFRWEGGHLFRGIIRLYESRNEDVVKELRCLTQVRVRCVFVLIV